MGKSYFRNKHTWLIYIHWGVRIGVDWGWGITLLSFLGPLTGLFCWPTTAAGVLETYSNSVC